MFVTFAWATVVASALYETTRDLAPRAPNFTSAWSFVLTQPLPLVLKVTKAIAI